MAATRRKQDDRNLEILRELINTGENRYCLDCGTRGPTYVNTTIGSFVCSKCSGMLRGLTPPHRVKSISMATFTSDEMELIKSRGNEYCRRIWLGLYDGDVSTKDEQSIRDFMTDKYEKKRYYLDPETTLKNGDVKTKVIAVATPLISIAPVPKPPQARSVNSVIPPMNANNFIPRPVNSCTHPVNRNNNIVTSLTQVPEFAVDFSTANIYNSSEYNNNTHNDKSILNNTTFNTINGPTPPANDRYAALADLDIELRQQKCFSSSEAEVVSRNPFQATGSDVFSSRNPFSNGNVWNAEPTPLPFNPFSPSTNMNGFGNSKNPFL